LGALERGDRPPGASGRRDRRGQVGEAKPSPPGLWLPAPACAPLLYWPRATSLVSICASRPSTNRRPRRSRRASCVPTAVHRPAACLAAPHEPRVAGWPLWLRLQEISFTPSLFALVFFFCQPSPAAIRRPFRARWRRTRQASTMIARRRFFVRWPVLVMVRGGSARHSQPLETTPA